MEPSDHHKETRQLPRHEVFNDDRKPALTGYFPGYFLDVQTLAEVLLKEERISLARTCVVLNTLIRRWTVGSMAG